MDNLLAGQVITEEESDAFYCMKAFAILSVVAAHTSTVMNGELFSEIVTKFWSVYARVGVPCFLILSGFFFQFTLESKREFWRKKATRVMKPWILCGMATYLLGCIRGRSFSFLGLLQWVAGYGSWYYYMTVLMMLYLFFGYFSSDICCCGALLANVLSLAYHDYFGENSFQYLNILNWAGFFAAGILMRRKRWDRKIRKCRWIVVVSALLCACGVTISVCTGRFGYFHLASFLYELSFFPVLLKLCLQIRIEALKKTYDIYRPTDILHFPDTYANCSSDWNENPQ